MKTTGLTTTLLWILLLAGCAASDAPPPAGSCQPDPAGILLLPTRPIGFDPDLHQTPPDAASGGRHANRRYNPTDHHHRAAAQR
jgi:hypothetical protein